MHDKDQVLYMCRMRSDLSEEHEPVICPKTAGDEYPDIGAKTNTTAREGQQHYGGDFEVVAVVLSEDIAIARHERTVGFIRRRRLCFVDKTWRRFERLCKREGETKVDQDMAASTAEDTNSGTHEATPRSQKRWRPVERRKTARIQCMDHDAIL